MDVRGAGGGRGTGSCGGSGSVGGGSGGGSGGGGRGGGGRSGGRAPRCSRRRGARLAHDRSASTPCRRAGAGQARGGPRRRGALAGRALPSRRIQRRGGVGGRLARAPPRGSSRPGLPRHTPWRSRRPRAAAPCRVAGAAPRPAAAARHSWPPWVGKGAGRRNGFSRRRLAAAPVRGRIVGGGGPRQACVSASHTPPAPVWLAMLLSRLVAERLGNDHAARASRFGGERLAARRRGLWSNGRSSRAHGKGPTESMGAARLPRVPVEWQELVSATGWLRPPPEVRKQACGRWLTQFVINQGRRVFDSMFVSPRERAPLPNQPDESGGDSFLLSAPWCSERLDSYNTRPHTEACVSSPKQTSRVGYPTAFCTVCITVQPLSIGGTRALANGLGRRGVRRPPTSLSRVHPSLSVVSIHPWLLARSTPRATSRYRGSWTRAQPA